MAQSLKMHSALSDRKFWSQHSVTPDPTSSALTSTNLPHACISLKGIFQGVATHPSKNGCHLQSEHQQCQWECQGREGPCSLTGSASSVDLSEVVPQKPDNGPSIWSRHTHQRYEVSISETPAHPCIFWIIHIGKAWTQSRCPSADERMNCEVLGCS